MEIGVIKGMEEKICQKKPEGAGDNYQRTKMQEEMIFQKLKERGCRITRQRRILLKIILQEEWDSCKEICYKARKENVRIGAATVYRMLNLLEDIGAISRKSMYTIPEPALAKTGDKECLKGHRTSFCMKHGKETVCIIQLDDHTTCRLSAGEWYLVMTKGLRACGYIKQLKVVGIMLPSCQKEENQRTKEQNIPDN